MSFLLLALVFRLFRLPRHASHLARVRRSASRVSTRALAAGAALVTLALPGSAAADWTVYVAGHIGISTGRGDVSGNVGPVDFNDSDRDSSPMIAGSVGLTTPMDELMAWKLPYGLELPEWPVRTEIEFAGLRDFEYRTIVNDGPVDDIFLTSSKSWAMMVNGFVDVPTTVLAKPLAWTFQTRKSTIRRVLDPITFYAGAGVGTAQVKLDAISTAAREATSDDFKFAWQVGTGFGYELTPFVTLDLGYRFFKTRDVDPTVRDSVGNVSGDAFVFSQRVNEFRAGIRVNLYSFTSPWKRLE
jgi:opacity protein-like surface antigen